MTEPHRNTDTGAEQELSELVAAVVRSHPSVSDLHGGEFGDIASYLPGRHVAGVRVTEVGEPVEVGVVLRLDRPLPEVVRDLRTRIETVVGKVEVDITVCDVQPVEGGGGGDR